MSATDRPALASVSASLKPYGPLPLANRFASLGDSFYTRLAPQPLPAPYLVGFSADAARLLGWSPEAARDPEFLATFAGNAPLPGGDPLASVYSGHQFGVWAGQLGDGRALLLGESDGPGGRWEIQIKGGGLTPYSRMGDGRAVLRSSIREFLGSEAMFHLGVPTTRALCVIGSDAPVRRETIETAAVVTRLSPSFIRFGHFEHFWANDQYEALRQLADFTIDHHYPHCRDEANPYLALLSAVCEATAEMVAHWQAVGFCHGVMNTDNMSILGLTIDYGPFGFLDGFNAHHICNHSDTQGRYAYQAQPNVAYWNLFCLAQALLPLFGEGDAAIEQAQSVLPVFKTRFAEEIDLRMRAKLGLRESHADDETLINRLFKLMHEGRVDFTHLFRTLAGLELENPATDAPLRDMFIDRAGFDAWAVDYRARLRHEASTDAKRAVAMRLVNPKYILRNHLAEIAIRRAGEKDFSEVDTLLRVLSRPYDEQPEFERYAELPPDWADQLEVSCSS
ncbi:YdiU family protein [Pandoraea horticolens]|uniref:Protein nucleotidyltransferase YdiU n=1 Tax=Pandoraea horticolens TaxID=2508298 RepID=A0A5E4X0V7_9BURK|nr:YdiU family protein [Pandoraea horticolens]VVE29951.1 YdiU family protein [Pandoraea horticolens]